MDYLGETISPKAAQHVLDNWDEVRRLVKANIFDMNQHWLDETVHILREAYRAKLRKPGDRFNLGMGEPFLEFAVSLEDLIDKRSEADEYLIRGAQKTPGWTTFYDVRWNYVRLQCWEPWAMSIPVSLVPR